ncbi:hypothetical protein V6N13_036647 [Hibiscus sabdariffa]
MENPTGATTTLDGLLLSETLGGRPLDSVIVVDDLLIRERSGPLLDDDQNRIVKKGRNNLKIQIGDDPSSTLVDFILLLLDRPWLVHIRHIPRSQNLVADKVVALCRGFSFESMIFDLVPVELAELVRQEVAAS